jgi:two-component system secretion response regulator SsrB
MIQKKYNSVVLADRSFTLSEGVRGLLETLFETVVVVANVTSLLESAERLQPEMAAVDVSLAQDGSVLWMAELRKRCPNIKLIALSVHDEPSVHRTVADAGCDGFILKRTIASELLPAVERLLCLPPKHPRPAATTEDNTDD